MLLKETAWHTNPLFIKDDYYLTVTYFYIFYCSYTVKRQTFKTFQSSKVKKNPVKNGKTQKYWLARNIIIKDCFCF